jgi:hypothetical protein
MMWSTTFLIRFENLTLNAGVCHPLVITEFLAKAFLEKVEGPVTVPSGVCHDLVGLLFQCGHDRLQFSRNEFFRTNVNTQILNTILELGIGS